MINVFAVMTPEIVNNATVPYGWSCQIDGRETPPPILPRIRFPTSMKVCSQDGLEDKEHYLLVYPQQNGLTLLLDYLEYLPSSSVNPGTYTYTGVSADDTSMVYNKAWSPASLPDGTIGMVSTPAEGTSWITYQLQVRYVFCVFQTL